MYGRPLQRKPSVRRPISFKWFELPNGHIENKAPGEHQHDTAKRLKLVHGKNVRLTPRYAR